MRDIEILLQAVPESSLDENSKKIFQILCVRISLATFNFLLLALCIWYIGLFIQTKYESLFSILHGACLPHRLAPLWGRVAPRYASEDDEFAPAAQALATTAEDQGAPAAAAELAEDPSAATADDCGEAEEGLVDGEEDGGGD